MVVTLAESNGPFPQQEKGAQMKVKTQVKAGGKRWT